MLKNEDEELVYIPVATDYMFRKMFANANKPEYFKAFYEAFFEKKVESIELYPNAEIKEREENKMIKLDALAKINGEYIHMEMQKQVHKGLEIRMQFYLSKILTRVIDEGTKYEDIKGIKSIWIFDGMLNHEDKIIVDKIRMMYKTRQKELCNQLVEIIVIELGKLDAIPMEDKLKSKRNMWLHFMRAKEVEEMGAARQLCPIIDTAITQECMESKRVAEEWAKIRDEEERRLYEMVVSNARSEGLKSGLRQGKKEGIRQGKKEGIRQGKREGINVNKVQVVTQMHKMNFKVEVISEIVDMPKSEVLAIIKGK